MGSKDQEFNLSAIIKKFETNLKIRDLRYKRESKHRYTFYDPSNKRILYPKHNAMYEYSIINLCEDVFISFEVTFIEIQIEDSKLPSKSSKREKQDFLKKMYIKKDDVFYGTVISISFFISNNDSTNNYTRIIRAEWDTLPTDSKHPQPHWHFCLGDINAQNIKDIDTFFEKSELEEILNQNKHIDEKIEKLHFAMAANLENNWRHQHPLTSIDYMNDWVIWLLGHAKEQFTFKN